MTNNQRYSAVVDCVGGEKLIVEPQLIFEEQYGDNGCEQEPYFSADALKGSRRQ